MNSSGSAGFEVVCLVDDDPSVLKAIGWLLASDGIAVRGFKQPHEFLDHARTHKVRLAVIDVWMTSMSGLEVQTQLGEISPETHVIIITGRQNESIQAEALKAGAVAFFFKPFDDKEFLAAVHRVLNPIPHAPDRGI